MFNPKVCPLFQSKLSWGMRILYSSGVWAYMCAAISTPTFIMIPLVCPAVLLLLLRNLPTACTYMHSFSCTLSFVKILPVCRHVLPSRMSM